MIDDIREQILTSLHLLDAVVHDRLTGFEGHATILVCNIEGETKIFVENTNNQMLDRPGRWFFPTRLETIIPGRLF